MFIVCICGRWNQTSNLLVSYSPLKQEEYAWLNYKLAYTPGGFKGLWNVYPKNLGRKGSNFFPSICPSIFWVRKNPPLRRFFWGQKMPPQAEEARQMVERWKATDVDVMSCWGNSRDSGLWNPPPMMSNCQSTTTDFDIFWGMGLDLNPFWMFFCYWLQEWGDEQCLSCGCWELHVKVNPTTTWNDDEAAGTFVTHTIHGCLVFSPTSMVDVYICLW